MTALAPVLRVRTSVRVPRGLVLCGLLAAGLALRLADAGRSLWLDETISVLQADRPIGQIIAIQANGFHPPLYHLQLHAVIAAFGDSPEALRGLSILWSLVAIAAIWGWSREAFPDVSPAPAAACAAFAPFAVWYGSEARMYAQLLALVSIGGWLAWRIVGRGATPLRVAGLAVVLVALAYTHYFAALFFASLGAVMLAIVFGRDALRRPAVWVLATEAVAAAALVPWLLYTLAHRTDPGALPEYPAPDIFSVLIAGLEMLVGFHGYERMGVLAAFWPALCLILLALLPRLHRVPWAAGGLVALVAAPPALLLLASAAAGHAVFDPRYLTVSTPPLYVLLGRGWHEMRMPGSLISGLALVAVAAAVSVQEAGDHGNPRLYQLREALASAKQEARAGDALVVVPQFTVPTVQRDPVLSYYPPPRQAWVINTITDRQRSPSYALWRAQAAGARRLLLLTTFESDPTTARVGIPARFERFFERAGRRVSRRTFANATLTIFDLPGAGRGAP